MQGRQGETLSGTGKKFLEIEGHQYKKDDIGKVPIRPVPDYNTKINYDIINDDGFLLPIVSCVDGFLMTMSLNTGDTVPRFFALIPAAGVGSRMKTSCPKQYLELLGKPVLWHCVEAFLACEEIGRVCVVVSPTDIWLDRIRALHPLRDDGRVCFLRCGGMTRRETVLNGLDAMCHEWAPDDRVLVHDAARPGLTPELIRRLVDTVAASPDGGILALPVADTVKRRKDDRVETISREGLWLAQTPQMFPCALLREALARYEQVTDEAGAVEAMGMNPLLVEGHLCNTKITRPSDLALVEMLMKAGKGR